MGNLLRNQLAEKRWWIQSENCIGHRAKCLGHFVVRFTVYFGQHPPIQRGPTVFCFNCRSCTMCGPASARGSCGNAERALGAFLADKARALGV